MMMGPAPMIMMEWMSVRFGMGPPGQSWLRANRPALYGRPGRAQAGAARSAGSHGAAAAKGSAG
ncbi:MAG: hypothetical protein HLUCCA09_01895 [Rhodobacteraceae bacterium HLUCCA09]|nr:MAG: hypothetical protein HLUCCA09_01895 [Rhodobacteraceae bacterium HLUCCA09]